MSNRSKPDADLFRKRALAVVADKREIELDHHTRKLRAPKRKRSRDWIPPRLDVDPIALARQSLKQAVEAGLANQMIEDPVRARQRRDRVADIIGRMSKAKGALEALFNDSNFTPGMLSELAAKGGASEPIQEGHRIFREIQAALEKLSFVSQQAEIRKERLTAKITAPGEAFWSGFVLQMAITYYQLTGHPPPSKRGSETNNAFVDFADAAIRTICPDEPSCRGLLPSVSKEFWEMLSRGALPMLDQTPDEIANLASKGDDPLPT